MDLSNKISDWIIGRSSRQYIALIVLWSLLLSTVAFISDPILNRDGMFYIDIARAMQLEGAGLSSERYGWAFLPMLLSMGGVIGLSPLTAAIFFSLLCGVLIPVMMFLFLSRYQPNYRHLTFLIACLLPWQSSFRADVLRDSGAWLFMLVSLYAAVRWLESRRLSWSLLLFSSAFAAFLFRIEMALLFSLGVYVPLVIRWRVAQQTGVGFLTWGFGFFIIAAMALMLLVAGAGYEYAQVYVNNFLYGGPFGTYAGFSEAVSAAANEYLNKDLGAFLFFGFFALVVLKIVSMLGMFSLPLYLSAFKGRSHGVLEKDGGATLMVAMLFLLPVCVFIFMNMFILSRYVMPTVIASSPFVLMGVIALWRDLLGARGRVAFVLIALLATVAAVTSTSAGKAYIKDTGRWLSEHAEELEPLQIRDERISFYARRGYVIIPGASEQDYTPALSEKFRTVVFPLDVKEGNERAEVKRIMALTGFTEILFMADNGAGDGAVVLSR
jgi:hypothetical protein